MMESSVSICPVPSEQLPINEYQELRESWFFSWATLDWVSYVRKMAWVWGWSWLLTGPVASASFAPQKAPGQFILCGAALSSFFIGLVLLQLYLGWMYVRDRLACVNVIYEESGWYDGQCWTKPPEVFTRDQLIATYEVQPILQRLQRTFAILVLSFGIGSLIWIIL
ncbi:CGLD27 family protein [Planktothrix sp. FACHB-1355]|uniref:CGLD27 family protein n=1 Tax=Aerosakkonema funiforme FACHB-1375 TaxID=2949571 RepID=A0A926ZGL8_9CYAN|nr:MULTISPECIES: CGLD27 family protein [Oscillatoriales]MBD2182135.1 CGLD27 family protein [Aerosakkonema funiforme FACHB-1375]MBD3562936.1 CGLD27 family protein [Planktothrix sp. FACHB-1355]